MAQFIGFWCQVSGFGCQGTEVLNPDTLYETTRGGTANRSLRRAQAEWNIEQEISNDEAGNRCVQSFLKNKNGSIPYFDIHYSLFDIRYSLFQSFFLDLTDRTFFWPAVGLNTDT